MAQSSATKPVKKAAKKKAAPAKKFATVNEYIAALPEGTRKIAKEQKRGKDLEEDQRSALED